MSWSLVGHGSTGFADGNSGHVYTFGAGAPAAGDLDLLAVNSDTTVPTPPSGWTLPAGGTFVNNQGAYVYYRKAAGTEGATVTVTTNGNFDTDLIWARFSGADALDVAVNAHLDNIADTTTPAVSTGTLAVAGELSFAFAALHPGAAATSPVWSAGYTDLEAVSQGVVTGFAAYKTTAGTAAETPSVTWTTTKNDRYIFVLTFTALAGIIVTLGQAAETDVAQPVTPVRVHAIGQATETDSATAMGRLKVVTLGQAQETDLAQRIGPPVVGGRLSSAATGTRLSSTRAGSRLSSTAT